MSSIGIVNLIIIYAKLLNVDPSVALAVAKIESNYNPTMIGASHKEVGVFQIRPEYITTMTREELFEPHNNVMMGIILLKETKERCIHKKNLSWLSCYNMGYTGAKKLQHPEQWVYVKKVRKEVERLKKLEYYALQNSF